MLLLDAAGGAVPSRPISQSWLARARQLGGPVQLSAFSLNGPVEIRSGPSVVDTLHMLVGIHTVLIDPYDLPDDAHVHNPTAAGATVYLYYQE